jgi:hypothetical protein
MSHSQKTKHQTEDFNRASINDLLHQLELSHCEYSFKIPGHDDVIRFTENANAINQRISTVLDEFPEQWRKPTSNALFAEIDGFCWISKGEKPEMSITINQQALVLQLPALLLIKTTKDGKLSNFKIKVWQLISAAVLANQKHSFFTKNLQNGLKSFSQESFNEATKNLHLLLMTEGENPYIGFKSLRKFDLETGAGWNKFQANYNVKIMDVIHFSAHKKDLENKGLPKDDLHLEKRGELSKTENTNLSLKSIKSSNKSQAKITKTDLKDEVPQPEPKKPRYIKF